MISNILPHNDYNLVLGLAVLLLTGLAFGKLSKKLHIPNVTGYLLGGFLIGPGFFSLFFPNYTGVVSTEYVESLKIIADIELAFIAFTVGTEFRFEYLKRLGPAPVVIAIFESLFAVIFITLGLLLFGFPLYIALAFGAVGGATAPAATVMVIRQYKAKGPLTEMIYSVVALDDASGLIFFGLATAIIHVLIGQDVQPLWLVILLPILEILGALVSGLLFGAMLVTLTNWFTGRGNRISIVIAVLFLMIALSRFITGTYAFELSSLLMAMFAGAYFTNRSKHVETIMPLVERITPPLIILFFVLSGADIQLEAFSATAVLILIIYLVFRVAGKLAGTYFGSQTVKVDPKVKKYLGFGLLPQGGIALGLSILMLDILPADIGLTYNGQLLRVVIIAAVFVSEFFGPILLKIALLKSKEATVTK
jgi:Kef-type K+ transport system membrane component KefB